MHKQKNNIADAEWLAKVKFAASNGKFVVVQQLFESGSERILLQNNMEKNYCIRR